MKLSIRHFASLIFIFYVFPSCSNAESNDSVFVLLKQTDTLFFISPENVVSVVIMPDSVPTKTGISEHKTKKLIAAVLAFPFPFGMLGLHRIYLGTKPYMPFAYIGTLGGCLGVLPLIDFIAILAADEEMIERYRNNPKVIMWSH